MKKTICLTFVILAIISCLTACNFTTNISGAMKDNAESAPKAEEMMSLMAENRALEAKALLHPQANEKADDALEQMIIYIRGRSINSMELVNINISSSTGTSGIIRQEQVSYQVVLDDGEIVYLNTVYLSNNASKGFVSFQLVLGVV